MNKANNGLYKKELSSFSLHMAGIGHILGAGVFVIIGTMAKYSGYNSWMSILLAGVFIFWLAQSYIKVHNKYPSNDSEHKLFKDIFGVPTANLTSASTLIGQILHLVVIAYAFGGYLNVVAPYITPTAGALICIGANAAIATYGIKQSAIFMNMTTMIEIIGVYSVILLGGLYMYQEGIPNLLQIGQKVISNLMSSSSDTSGSALGVLIGGFIITFAYFGFETLVRLTEESKDPNDVPIAMNNSIYFTTFTYILVSLVSFAVATPGELGSTLAPLVLVMSKLPLGSYLVTALSGSALFSTFNTYLMAFIGNTRLLAGIAKDNTADEDSMQKDNILLKKLSTIDEVTNTPINSTMLMSIAILFLVYLNIDITNATVLGNIGIILSIALIKIADIMNYI